MPVVDIALNDLRRNSYLVYYTVTLIGRSRCCMLCITDDQARIGQEIMPFPLVAYIHI